MAELEDFLLILEAPSDAYREDADWSPAEFSLSRLHAALAAQADAEVDEDDDQGPETEDGLHKTSIGRSFSLCL